MDGLIQKDYEQDRKYQSWRRRVNNYILTWTENVFSLGDTGVDEDLLVDFYEDGRPAWDAADMALDESGLEDELE